MSSTSHEHGIVQPILDAIGSWVKEYRQAVGMRGELANFREEEVAFIANDMGMTPQELLFAVSKGPHAADELPKLLRDCFEIGCQACNSSNSAFASFRSSVSKPSVNQP